jgi:hypothetical protein
VVRNPKGGPPSAPVHKIVVVQAADLSGSDVLIDERANPPTRLEASDKEMSAEWPGGSVRVHPPANVYRGTLTIGSAGFSGVCLR